MNSTFLKAAPLLLAAGFALGGASTAHAQVTINYSLGSFMFTTPNQYASFNLSFRPNTLTLMPGVAQTVNIQGIQFFVNDTNNFQTQDYTGNVSRTLTVNGVTQSAVQGYDLTTNPGASDGSTFADDTLTFTPGSANQMLTFNLGSQGTLKFTPELIDGNGFFDKDSNPPEYQSNVQGKFLLTAAAVPEASSLVSTGILLTLGLGAFILRSRKRSSTQA